jgi:hypothetical protein
MDKFIVSRSWVDFLTPTVLGRLVPRKLVLNFSEIQDSNILGIARPSARDSLATSACVG